MSGIDGPHPVSVAISRWYLKQPKNIFLRSIWENIARWRHPPVCRKRPPGPYSVSQAPAAGNLSQHLPIFEPTDDINLRLTAQFAASFDAVTRHWVTDNRNTHPDTDSRWRCSCARCDASENRSPFLPILFFTSFLIYVNFFNFPTLFRSTVVLIQCF